MKCENFTSNKGKLTRAALSSATQHAMPPEFGRKWGTECLNTTFQPILLCAGYNVKQVNTDNIILKMLQNYLLFAV